MQKMLNFMDMLLKDGLASKQVCRAAVFREHQRGNKPPLLSLGRLRLDVSNHAPSYRCLSVDWVPPRPSLEPRTPRAGA